MSCEDTRAWKTHVCGIRPELRTPRASVNIQLGESDNSFQGADTLVDEIRRKGDAVHFVLRYKGEYVIVRFNIVWTELLPSSRMSMPLIATVSCYAARAIPSAVLRVTLSCIDEEQRSTTEERVVMPITQWPTAANEFDMKTMMALYKYAKIREVQLTLEVAITDTEGEPMSDALRSRSDAQASSNSALTRLPSSLP